MRFTNHKRRQPPPVIIIALIDVLMVVLIFLMVTTTFKHQQPAIKLALPVSDQAPAGVSEQNPLIVTVAREEPFFYLEALPVTFDRLKMELENRARQNPELHLVIRGDRDAAFGKVVHVMDAAKAAQIRSVNAYVERPGS